jgi:hypothetical protein
MTGSAPRKRLLLPAIVLLGTTLLLFLAIEGASSVGVVLYESVEASWQFKERAHTDYDTLLGWVNRRNFADRNNYGPGIYLSTNGQRLRNNHEVTPQVPEGRRRVICSGDSFTLGWGVDDDQSWCALLEHRDPRLEAVNMGQGGYGIDQAYLWYKRDGQRFDHDLQIFAFILADFDRMRHRTFLGFGKPILVADHDTLRVDNVPVPRWTYRVPWLTGFVYNTRSVPSRFRIVQLAEVLERRFLPRGSEVVADPDSATWDLADRVLADLARINRAKHSNLVVVFLPMREDGTGGDADAWRRWLGAAAQRDGFLFVDLIEEFRKLPQGSVDSLFPKTALGHLHLGPRGHAWVADQVYERLLGSPEIAQRLAMRRSP